MPVELFGGDQVHLLGIIPQADCVLYSLHDAVDGDPLRQLCTPSQWQLVLNWSQADLLLLAWVHCPDDEDVMTPHDPVDDL